MELATRNAHYNFMASDLTVQNCWGKELKLSFRIKSLICFGAFFKMLSLKALFRREPLDKTERLFVIIVERANLPSE